MNGFSLNATVFLTLTLAVAPSARADCTGDTDCKHGRVCKSGACIDSPNAGCSRDRDCPGDAICSGGECLDPHGSDAKEHGGGFSYVCSLLGEAKNLEGTPEPGDASVASTVHRIAHQIGL